MWEENPLNRMLKILFNKRIEFASLRTYVPQVHILPSSMNPNFQRNWKKERCNALPNLKLKQLFKDYKGRISSYNHWNK